MNRIAILTGAAMVIVSSPALASAAQNANVGIMVLNVLTGAVIGGAAIGLLTRSHGAAAIGVVVGGVAGLLLPVL